MSINVFSVFFGSLFLGIKMWQNSRWFSLLCFSPVFFIIDLISLNHTGFFAGSGGKGKQSFCLEWNLQGSFR